MGPESNLSRDPPGVYYPVSDDMGESGLQLFVTRLLMGLLEDYFAALERAAFVGCNQFFYYKQGDPRSVVAPDLYVIDGVSLHPTELKSWKTWEHDGKAPTLALEIVSDEYQKDYSDRLLERYQDLGVRELVRYDPVHLTRRKRELFAHFVRDERGQLVRRPNIGDRIQLVSYDLWLVRGAHDELRLGLGPKGESLWPTAQERIAQASERAAADAERAAAEAARADAEAARAVAEAERAASEAARAAAEAERAASEAARAAAEAERADSAQAELERLRAELAALRRG
ncbi:Uma2 family endonuclease [Nannocystis pusilla]|uniref:Uma2 family endonuclease n=1 Tax=Nannocystis pusilla TaxID=889268 RepID=UPI003DA321FD